MTNRAGYMKNAPDGTQAGLHVDLEHRREVSAGRSRTVDPPTVRSVGWEIGASTCGPVTCVSGRSEHQNTRVKG
ncbi:phage tail protein [Streptomyces lydicamycinicus]|uniref:Phage tail protein n=1 Tax=Streptomyces lydicamycinicus TaxID=1546107 RepID=A0A0P4R9A5_9ACTN|nr:phage tail protein [Streptomyces lydicamycinicus]